MNNNKKILILSSHDIGGAGEAMVKLQKILFSLGYNAVLLVGNKQKNDVDIVAYQNTKTPFKKILERIKQRYKNLSPLKLDPNYCYFSTDEIKKNIDTKKVLDLIGFKPDYIITGYTAGFTNSTDLYNLQKATSAKVYNITVDMNHFTGGCHYAWDCMGYIQGCGSNCPAILTSGQKVLAKKNFERKLENARLGNFQIIAGSGLTLEQAKKSKIYGNQKNHFNINSLIDIEIFNDKNRGIAKQIFDLDKDKINILCGAQNANEKRKGFEYLIEALTILERELPEGLLNKIQILVVSNNKNSKFEILKITKKYIDFVKDYRLLVLLYQSVDLFVNCSIEDSGPMMVSEALACGTPVVGFDTGVVTNMVVDDYNGYKAENKNSQALAEAIEHFISLPKLKRDEFSKNAVSQVETHSSFKSARNIFKELFMY